MWEFFRAADHGKLARVRARTVFGAPRCRSSGLAGPKKLHGCNGTYLIVFLMILIFLTARFNGQVLTTNVSVIQLNDVAVR